MRYSTALLPLVATATAIVIPDDATAKQLIFETKQKAEKTVSSWWDNLPTVDDIFSSVEKQASKLGSLVPDVEYDISELPDFLSPSDYSSSSSSSSKPPGHGHHWPPRSTNLTIYEAIQASNYTKKFAALVDDFPDIVQKLNSTSAGNVTALIPTDHAFEKIPHHGKGHKGHKPPKEFIEKILEYHVLPGLYPAGRVLAHHTLPTALEEEALGGRPQRVRVSVGLFGLKLNFYSKVVFANLFTKNGVLHGIDSILVPPPPVERVISLFPSKFSTLSLAAEKTGFTHHHAKHLSSSPSDTDEGHLTGLTLFAPTNRAFQKLGPRANAFLFNTPKGLHFLKALLAYHVVANETLYSDAYYGKKKESDGDEDGAEEGSKGAKHLHLDLPTLLDDKHIAVDIDRWFGFIKIKLNGHVAVAIQDGLARDGVVQVLDSVLIPPHPHKGFWNDEVDGEIDVQELVERLQPYVENEKEKEVEVGEL